MTSLPVKNSTQEFTEIKSIQDTIVFFSNGTAALPIEIAAINFSLLSQDEQDARIGAFASFVNSLSFPIQILAINKRVDISSYIHILNTQINTLENQKVSTYMQEYRNFVEQLVKQNTVLDKHFYIIIFDYATNAQMALTTKADTIRGQLTRINLQTRTLNKEDIIELFSNLYNHKKQEEKP